MSWIDIIIILLIAFGAFKGYRDGFLVELFSLLGIVLGILGGFKLLGVSLIYLSEHFNIDEKILPYVAFGAVFIIILLVVSLIGKALKASIEKSFLGRIDEMAGAALGLIKTAFVLSVFFWIVGSLKIAFPSTWQEDSKFLPFLTDFAPMVTSWIGELIPAFNDIF
ncbi:CvpA family protein [Chryseosolibacter indicus]|uniref:CvpA family protein n=1 Tax=Chryseosolibacter indicus TaxID=2782351 RepID=A0ABS5VX51_9BACT|nr:CvpA family protein [Chryseosolibacter indicus]MBT1706003.1 CvpA family protein [Chryseosolibacter indicus]